MDLHNQSDPLADLLARGRYPQALPLAQAAVDRLPDDAPAAARAAALETLGVVLRELGEYARAEGPLLQALSARGGAGKESPAYARTLTELGRLYEEQAQYANAEKLFRSALELCEQAGGPDHLDVADRLYDLGKLLDHLGRFDEATACHDRARAIHQAHGVDRPEYALSLAAGAWADWRRGRLEQAAEAVRTATALLARTRGEDHPDYATCCQFLSRIGLHQARIDEAESLADKVLAVRRARLGERHHRYGGALENLALIRTLQGRADEATALARQGLEITRQALGERHPFVADGLAALAYALQAAGHPDEAEVHAREALAVCEAALGSDHPHLANCHRDLAEAVAAQHRTDEADTHYLRALDILRRYGPTCRVEIIETLQGRARLLAACNRPDEAVAAARQAVALAREAGADGGSPLLLAGGLDSLARVYQAVGQLAEAEPIWREVLTLREQTLGGRHPLYAETLRCLAGLYLAQGDFEQADRYEARALDILRQTLGERHPEYVQALCGLAEMHWQRGQPAQAEQLYFQAGDIERDRVGEHHPDYAGVMRQLARMYQGMNNFPAAEVRLRHVLEVMERTYGDEHPEYANALHDLAALHHQMGDLLTAEGMYQQASELRQQHPGEASAEYGQSLHGLAQVYQGMGRYDDAAPLFRRALDIHEQALGGDHLATLRVRHSQALFEHARGHFHRAEDLLAQVRDQLVQVAGPVSPMLIPVLTDQARMYSGAGNHLSAEECWRRVLEINRQVMPDDKGLHAQDLINLALCLRAAGDLAAAEPLVRSAVELLEQVRGQAHPETAAAVGLLAGIRQGLEDEAAADVAGPPPAGEAERLYRDALDRTRVALGQAHPEVAVAQSELAAYCASRGRIAEGVELCRKACDLLRQAHGEDHLEYLNQLRTLAALYQAAGRFPEAEAALRQRVTVLRRLFGPGSSMLVPAQQLLADLYRQHGRLDEAEALCRQAVETFRRVWSEQATSKGDRSADEGPSEPPRPAGPNPDLLNLALAENHLATVYLAARRPAEAEGLLRQAVEDLNRAGGPDHPGHGRFLFQLAWLCAGTGRAGEAMRLLERVADQEARALPQLLSLESDRVRVFHGQGLQETYETYLALAVPRLLERGERRGPTVRRVYDLVLQRKRLGVALLAAPLLALWQRKYPEQTRELRRLWLLDRQIGFKWLSGPIFEEQTAHQEMLTGWQEQREALEGRLARQVPEVAERVRLRGADTAAVAAALPDRWALVDVVYYRPPDFRGLPRSMGPPPASGSGKPRVPTDPGRYVAFVLRKGAEAPTLVELGAAATLDPLLRGWRDALIGGERHPAEEALRAAVWAPLEPHLAGCDGIVLSPDGSLLHVPLDALPIGPPRADGEPPRLLDRFVVRHALTGRDVLRLPATGANEPPVVAGVDLAAPSPAGSSLERFGRWLRRTLSREAEDAAGDAVPATVRVAELLGVEPCPPDELRGRLQAAREPRLLHLDFPACFPTGSGESPPEESGNPLLAIGLAVPPDDLLSGRDASRLDLWTTEVVTLADVDTPIEQPLGWTRLVGLLGAFLRAGAAAVVLSLWRAPEPARRALIEAYYQALTAGRSPAAALAEARRAVRQRWPEPAAWAGWVCLGDVTPEKQP